MRKLGILAMAMILVVGMSAGVMAISGNIEDSVDVDVNAADYAEVDFLSPSIQVYKWEDGLLNQDEHIDDPDHVGGDVSGDLVYGSGGDYGYMASHGFYMLANDEFDLNVTTDGFKNGSGEVVDDIEIVGIKIYDYINEEFITKTSVGGETVTEGAEHNHNLQIYLNYDLGGDDDEIASAGDYAADVTLTVSAN